MDLQVLQAFIKHAMLGEDTPEDYHATRVAVAELFPGLEKQALSSAALYGGGAALGAAAGAGSSMLHGGDARKHIVRNTLIGAAGVPAAIAGANKASYSTLLKHASWSWKGFKEGLVDEGIPLAGATVGAGVGGLRGAALGYAVGGGASMLRSKLRGEEPSMGRKLLAASALGYGVGGLAHGGLEKMTHGARRGSFAQKAFHPGNAKGTFGSRLMEEALPAAGATLATGYTVAKSKPGEHE